MAIVRKCAICGICPGGCEVIATVQDGRLVKVEADLERPFGALCVRGRAAPEIVYSPDRLSTPLIRIGEKGEGKFRKATWDEALDKVADSMKAIKAKYGAQAMAYHSGRGVFEQSISDHIKKWLFAYGSPNMASVNSLCAVAFLILAPVPTFGFSSREIAPDIENSNLIVVWGANPLTDSPPTMLPRIIKARRRGARLVAIDHMKSDIARRADEWIAVRSGTDGALALGMLRVIINEELYDKEFVTNWTVGFEELKRYVQQFTPDEVQRITNLPAATMIKLAREIATTKQTSLVMYTGLEYTNSGVQNIRAVYLLWALTGHLDEPGGLYITPAGRPSSPPAEARLPDDVRPIGSREFPFFYEQLRTAQFTEFPRSVLEGKPYPIKGLLVHGANILVNYPQTELFAKAFSQLDFIGVIDIFPTEDMKYADVVLPAATYFEINAYQRYKDYVRLRERVIEPVGEARNNVLILGAIAERLGCTELFPRTEDEILERSFARRPELVSQLKANPDGLKLTPPVTKYQKWQFGMLRADGKPGFNTPSGKVEIASSMLAKHGYDALPVYIDPIEGPLSSPKLAKDYPLVLNTGARLINTFRSQHLNIPSLVRMQENPQVLLNTVDAEKRGIKDGDKVVVRTKRGQVQLWASVGEKVVPGGVEVNVGGGSSIQVESWRNANVNYITDLYNRDAISGFPIFKALLCEVEKA
jgi:anaerobic selenocysteine-containing dehydrogenase